MPTKSAYTERVFIQILAAGLFAWLATHTSPEAVAEQIRTVVEVNRVKRTVVFEPGKQCFKVANFWDNAAGTATIQYDDRGHGDVVQVLLLSVRYLSPHAKYTIRLWRQDTGLSMNLGSFVTNDYGAADVFYSSNPNGTGSGLLTDSFTYTGSTGSYQFSGTSSGSLGAVTQTTFTTVTTNASTGYLTLNSGCLFFSNDIEAQAEQAFVNAMISSDDTSDSARMHVLPRSAPPLKTINELDILDQTGKIVDCVAFTKEEEYFRPILYSARNDSSAADEAIHKGRGKLKQPQSLLELINQHHLLAPLVDRHESVIRGSRFPTGKKARFDLYTVLSDRYLCQVTVIGATAISISYPLYSPTDKGISHLLEKEGGDWDLVWDYDPPKLGRVLRKKVDFRDIYDLAFREAVTSNQALGPATSGAPQRILLRRRLKN